VRHQRGAAAYRADAVLRMAALLSYRTNLRTHLERNQSVTAGIGRRWAKQPRQTAICCVPYGEEMKKMLFIEW